MAGCSHTSSEASRCERFRFDATLWRQNSPVHDGELTPRQRLADELQRCKTLKGKTMREVRALLGPREESGDTRYEWIYTLGAERGPYSVDDEIFIVEFSGDGTVWSVSKAVT